MTTELKEIKDIIFKVAKTQSTDRSTSCAYDLIDGIICGEYKERKNAWDRDLNEHLKGEGRTDTIRNGIWVPAIQM